MQYTSDTTEEKDPTVPGRGGLELEGLNKAQISKRTT